MQLLKMMKLNDLTLDAWLETKISPAILTEALKFLIDNTARFPYSELGSWQAKKLQREVYGGEFFKIVHLNFIHLSNFNDQYIA